MSHGTTQHLLRKRFNIGMVGSVSNGKTTLVEQLSGINTKRHSNEIKGGCTVKLGYANLLLWKCALCDVVYTTGQKSHKKECDQCNHPCQLEFELSLVDAPGHSAYIRTMIRGSSIMEAAIVVTDVNQIPHQHQTLEHLAILEILGVKHVLVIQNKCDLVNEEACKAHYQELKKQFQGTIADSAPVIPVCAQRGLNIPIVVSELYAMCLKLQKDDSTRCSSSFHGLAIVRSFDINKPDTGVQDLKGGVIGGCLIGPHPIRVGDIIEVRPGLVRPDQTYIPLKTKVLTVFSEQKSVPQCEWGGLFALGTNLDPTATKSDRLIGCVAGDPLTLPPVVTTHTVKLTYVSFDPALPKPKVMDQQTYYFMWGNLVVMGRVTRLPTKHHIHVKYEHPICNYSSRCIIYEKTAQTKLTLIGFGTLVEPLNK